VIKFVIGSLVKLTGRASSEEILRWLPLRRSNWPASLLKSLHNFFDECSFIKRIALIFSILVDEIIPSMCIIGVERVPRLGAEPTIQKPTTLRCKVHRFILFQYVLFSMTPVYLAELLMLQAGDSLLQ